MQSDEAVEETVVPVTFGRMLGRGFSLFGRTVVPTAVLAVVILVPLIYFAGDTVRGSLLLMADTVDARGLQSPTAEQVTTILAEHPEHVLLFYLLLFLLTLGYNYVMTATVIFGWNVVIGEQGGFSRSFGRPFLMSLIQAILMSILVMLASFCVTLLISGFSGGVTDMLMMLFRVALLYFSAVTLFRIHEIVADDRGPWHGLVSSIALARVDILRVFCTFLLLALMASVLGAIWYMLAVAPILGADPANSAVLDGSSSAGLAHQSRVWADLLVWRSTVSAGLLLALGITLGVSIVTSLYTDLRARRGDFTRGAEEIEVAGA